MNNRQLILIGIMAGSILVMIFLLLLMMMLKKRQKLGFKAIKTKDQTRSKQEIIYQKLYRVLSRSWITKRYIYDIRSRLEMLHNYGEAAIRKKAVQLYLRILIVLSLLVILFIAMTNQLYSIVIFIVALWFLGETIIDYFVVRIRNKLLNQQIHFNNTVRHKYYETKMVDEALYEASQMVEDQYEIGIQGQKIYDALTAKDAEKEILKYYDTAPNKYLKMLAGLAYMTLEYGDTYVNGVSVFMKNLNDLSSALRIEVFKRDRLNYALKSLNIIVLLPLFFMNPIKSWAGKNFLPLGSFYDSSYGFVLEVAMFGIIWVCYFAIRKIQQFDDRTLYLINKKSISEKIYKRFYFIIDPLLPRKCSDRAKFQSKLNKTFSRLKIEVFYTRRLLFGLFSFIIAFIIVVMMHRMAVHHVLFSPTMPDGFLGGQLSRQEAEKAEAITRQDRQIIKEVGRATDLIALQKYMRTHEGRHHLSDASVDRILEKLSKLNHQYIRWWEILLCLIVFIVGYQVPFLSIHFQKEVRKMDMEDEVSHFQAIILMLMHHQRISVEELLEWMERFSFTFREPIQNCVNSLAYGMDEALEELKHVVSFKGFQKIIEQLQMAANDLSLVQAFDELESEKNYYQEQRKETNNRIIQKKTGLGRAFGFLPIYALLLVYLMLPMLITSINEMNTYFSKLSLS